MKESLTSFAAARSIERSDLQAVSEKKQNKMESDIPRVPKLKTEYLRRY
jgi:hypothetical protein